MSPGARRRHEAPHAVAAGIEDVGREGEAGSALGSGGWRIPGFIIHQRTSLVKDAPRAFRYRYSVTSGRGSGSKPSRLGMATFGSVCGPIVSAGWMTFASDRM